MWVASMAYSHASTSSNIAEYRGLVHGLRQAKVKRELTAACHRGQRFGARSISSDLIAPHGNGRHDLPKARALAGDLAVVSWGHHYRDYNKMADRVANIAMDTCTSVQVHTPSDCRIVKDVAAFIDNDVNHWLKTSMDEHPDLRGPAMTATGRAISAQHLAQRRFAVRA